MESPVFHLTPFDRLLLDCLHQDEDRRKAICETSLNGAQWHVFLHTATRHCVSALVFYRLKTGGQLSVLPEPIQRALFDRYMENSARNVRIFFCLKKILKAFHAEDIPVITLKGAHLAHRVYPNVSVREMSDIDLLVPRDKLKAADSTLQDLGYIPERPYDIDFELAHFVHLPKYEQPASPVIELHWAIAEPKPTYCFDVTQFWQDTEHFQIEGVDVQGLSLEWLLAHICTHISHHHGFINSGLRGYCDITEVLDRHGAALNWQLFEDITLRSGVKRGVFLTLYVAKELLGAKVPDETLKVLQPSNMRDQFVKTVLNKCLSDQPMNNMNPIVAGILQHGSIWAKAKGMVKRLFLPRKIIASKYGLDPNAWYLFIFYPVRLKDLIRHHKQTILDHTKGDKHTTSVVQNVSMLQDWLAGR